MLWRRTGPDLPHSQPEWGYQSTAGSRCTRSCNCGMQVWQGVLCSGILSIGSRVNRNAAVSYCPTVICGDPIVIVSTSRAIVVHSGCQGRSVHSA